MKALEVISAQRCWISSRGCWMDSGLSPHRRRVIAAMRSNPRAVASIAIA